MDTPLGPKPDTVWYQHCWVRIQENFQSYFISVNKACQSIKQHFILYTIKIVHFQGDMFRPLLGHLQALWENRSKSYPYFNAFLDSKFIEV